MNFGEQIKQQRKALDMSQEEVAKRLFVTRQTISNWENGKNYPDLSMLVKISDVYQVSIDSLLKEDTKLKEYLSKKEVRTVSKSPLFNSPTVTLSDLFFLRKTKQLSTLASANNLSSELIITKLPELSNRKLRIFWLDWIVSILLGTIYAKVPFFLSNL